MIDQGTARPVVGRLVGFKSVPTRGIMSLTVDVDADAGQAAMRYLGTPLPGTDIHVALMRLSTPDPEMVVHGTYCAFKMVQGRSALALTIEIPLERGHSTVERLGVPRPGQNIEVAVALLTGLPVERTKPPRDPGAAAVQQAALRAKDRNFQRWILGAGYDETGSDQENELAAIEALRAQLGIRSRSELRQDTEKLREWHAMIRRFEIHLQGGAAAIQE